MLELDIGTFARMQDLEIKRNKSEIMLQIGRKEDVTEWTTAIVRSIY